ncbi:unnamed protein product [Auanema sp. JU1783]|nr:unnamed protein product [Auanema sp. JU1783]
MADSAANEAPASAPAAECQGTPKRNLNTQQRLFGADDAKPTPKRNTPTYKSSIFSEETPASPQRTPKRTIPTLGEFLTSNFLFGIMLNKNILIQPIKLKY